MEIVNMHEAKSRLSALIKKVLSGEQVIIARNNNPVVELKIFKKEQPKRKLGLLSGQFEQVGSWGEMDKEIQELFENSKIFPDEKDID